MLDDSGCDEMAAAPRTRTVTVRFRSAAEATHNVAGLPAAARIVRELSEAGYSNAVLVLPDAPRLPRRAQVEVERLAGAMAVAVGKREGPDSEPVFPGDRLIPAALLPAVAEGRMNAASVGLSLYAPTASRRLLQASGKASDGPVSRWLNRPVSRQISRLLLQIPGVRPIHATIGTILISLLMFAALISGTASGLLIGALLFHAASVFDGTDGEIARVTFRCTRLGAVLDTGVDVGTNVLLILGITLNLASRGEPTAPILASWGFVLFLVGLAAIAWRSARLEGPFSLDLVKLLYGRRFRGPVAGSLIRFLTIVSSRDFFALLFALLALAGVPMAVLYLFAAAATVWIVFVAASFLMPATAAIAEPQT